MLCLRCSDGIRSGMCSFHCHEENCTCSSSSIRNRNPFLYSVPILSTTVDDLSTHSERSLLVNFLIPLVRALDLVHNSMIQRFRSYSVPDRQVSPADGSGLSLSESRNSDTPLTRTDFNLVRFISWLIDTCTVSFRLRSHCGLFFPFQ